MTKYFIADPLHINQKNFSSLYAYLDKTKADVPACTRNDKIG